MAKGKARPFGWEQLTWSALGDWAGERSLERGLKYFRGGHVSDLAVSEDGALLATVQGTQRYTTSVSLGDGPEEIDGVCTCPIGGCCKHAVAVVLAYLDAVEKKTPAPTAGPDDPRWDRLQRDDGESDDDWADEDDGYDDYEDDIDEPPPTAVSRRPVKRAAPKRATPADRKDRVRAMLAGWSEDRLVEYVLQLAANYPDVRQELDEQAALQSGNVGELIRETRKEIRKRTAEEAWENHWNDEGHLPDYGGVRRRFEKLLEAEQFDALLDLGRELFDLGQAQVEQAHDEGETGTAIRGCLAIVARAVPKSSRPPADQLLYCINLMESDEYDLAESFAEVTERKWPKKVWSAVADTLKARPRPEARGEDRFYGQYERERQNRWIVEALDKAGRGAEELAFLEAEAPLTQNYQGLVGRLLEAGRTEDARRWALEGIAATKAEWPGIAEQLHAQLRQMAEQAKDWPLVAAYDARPFFKRPSVEGLKTLLAAAKKAGLEDAVRAGAMYFAETGKQPDGKKGAPAWPLPEVPDPPAREGTDRRDRAFYPAEREKPGPSYQFLIDLAIKEKRLADALTWYDAWAKDPANRYRAEGHYAEYVADAVRGEFPERALEVYRRGADRALQSTGDSAYRETVKYLRKIKEVLGKLGRAAEWQAYETRIREEYKRRRNFIEMLDRMDRDRIIGGSK